MRSKIRESPANNVLYTEKSSVRFTEYFKICGFKRSLNKEIYNFRNFQDIMQNC